MCEKPGPAKEAADVSLEQFPRIQAAWHTWLEALADDAEVALGAALAYQQLASEARDAFLQVLQADAQQLDVPRIALYAPLLSVETDPDRRDRLIAAIGDEEVIAPGATTTALRGVDPKGQRVGVFVTPLYLSFNRVITCRYCLEQGVIGLSTDPLVHLTKLPIAGQVVDGVQVEDAPFRNVIDEVAVAIVAQRRSGEPLPESLQPLINLFDIVHQ